MNELVLTKEEIERVSKIVANAIKENVKAQANIIASVVTENNKRIAKIVAEVVTEKQVSFYFTEIIREEEARQRINLDLISSALHGITDPLGQLQSWLSIQFYDVINTVYTYITSWIQSSALWYWVEDIWDRMYSVYNTITSALPGVGVALASLPSYIYNTITSFITAARDTLSSYISSVTSFFTNTLPSYFSVVVNFFTVTVPNLFPIVTNFFTNVIPSYFSIVTNFFTNAIPQYFSIVTKFFTEAIPTYFSVVTNFFTNTFPQMVSTVTRFFTETLPQYISYISNFFATTLPKAIETISTFFSRDLPTLIDKVRQFIATISQIPSQASDIIKSVAFAVWNTVSTMLYNELFVKYIAPTVQGVTQLSANVLQIGVSIQGFVNAVLELPRNLQTMIERFADVAWSKVQEFIARVRAGLELIVEVGTKVVKTIYERITSFTSWLYESLASSLSTLASIVENAVLNAVAFIAEKTLDIVRPIVQRILDIAKRAGEGIGRLIVDVSVFALTPIYDAFAKWSATQLDKLANKFLEIDTPAENVRYLAEALQIIVFDIVSVHYATWGVSFALHRFAGMCEDLQQNITLNLEGEGGCALEPGGLGVRLKQLLGMLMSLGWKIKPSWMFREIAKDVRELSDTFTRGLMYGLTIWMTNPIVKLLNAAYRDILVIDLPSIPTMQEIVRRHMPTDQFDYVLKRYVAFLKLYGYRTEIIKWITDQNIKIEVVDRFGTRRTIPLALIYEMPSASDVARMAIRDIFGMGADAVSAFLKVYSARGMYPDIGILYYLLHYKYPPPERLWTFTVRAVSGLLWATITSDMKDKIKAEANSLGAVEPTDARYWNFKAREVFSVLQTYMTWHDYARFSWIRKELLGLPANFTSDNQIIIDTLADIPTKIDQRWMCVPPDTVILGDNKPISEYNVGDEVLYGGRVLETFIRPFNGELVVIKGLGLLPIKVTPEHPILVVDGEIRWKYYSRNGKIISTTQKVFSKPYFIEAEKVQLAPVRSCGKTYVFRRDGHYLVSPRLKGEYDIKEIDLSKYFKNYCCVPKHIREKLGVYKPKLMLDEELAWLFGFYVGDGSTSKEQVEFYPSSEEHVNRIARIIERYGFKPSIIKVGRAYNVLWSSRALKRFFDTHFGNKAHEKRIPDFILLHKDERILWSFLQGYLDADGNKAYNNPNKYEALTVSKILALQIQSLCFRLGLSCGITEKSEVQALYTDKAYRLTIIFNRDEKHARIKFTEDFVFIPIIKISREPYNGVVCNLETERNVYLVSNVIVHNCKWGLYEHLSAKGVTINSEVKEFATRVLEGNPVSGIRMDITNFSRTLQATGLHPDWIPVTAVAETMNMLAEERTLLRTGFMNLFKEGFYDWKALEKLLAGFIKASFQVAYFDSEKMTWTTGWINLPVMFLPPERRLLELRALMDRALDILREIQRDVTTAYQEFIIDSYDEYKQRLSAVIDSINEFYAKDYENITESTLPDELKLKFVEDYYKPYVRALDIWRDVYTIRRMRTWASRWLGWVIYRMAFGYVSKEDVNKVLDYVSEACKLAPKETDFIRDVMELLADIAKRDTASQYLPTPSTMATLSEYITLDAKIVEQVLTERGIPDYWKQVWLTYISVRPIKSDASALLSAYIRAFRYGVVSKAEVDTFISSLASYGFTKREIEIRQKIADLEEMILQARDNMQQYIPTPMTLATICEYLPEAREFFDDVVKARRIPQNWVELWATYIDIRPLIDDMKRYLARAEDLYVRFMIDKRKFDEVLNEVAGKLGYTPKEIEFLRKVTEFERYKNAWIELIGTVNRLVELSEYSPTASEWALGKLNAMIDALPLSDDEKRKLKTMWEEYIRNRPVKSEAKMYITQLINAYVDGIISDTDFDRELQSMKKWGFSDTELQFYKQIATVRKARKLRIPLVYGE